MEIKLDFALRQLNYEIDGVQGVGIDDLVENIGRKDDRIKKISLSGNTDSYTLMRQVYLFINLCRAMVDCAVVIDGKQMPSGALVPDYTATGYKFNGDCA